MEKLQYLYVPMAGPSCRCIVCPSMSLPCAGILGIFNIPPLAAIGAALIVDALDNAVAYAILMLFVLLSYYGVFNTIVFTPDQVGHFTLIYEV